MAIAFNWGNSHHGGAGSITNVNSVEIGVTNKRFTNGTFNRGNCLIAAVLVRANAGVDQGAISVPDFQPITDNFNATTGLRLWAGYRIAAASESGSYSASWASASSPGIGWLLLNFGGVDQRAPIDIFAHQHNTASTQTHPVPSITPIFGDSYWLAIEARIGSNVPDTPSAPLVLLYDAQGNTSSGRPEICSAGLQLTSAAPTGIGVFTQAAFTQPSQGISIALKTASSGGRGKRTAVHVPQHAGDFRSYLDKKRAEHRKSAAGAETARAIELAGDIKATLRGKATPDAEKLQRKSEALRELVSAAQPLKQSMTDLTQAVAEMVRQYAQAHSARAAEAQRAQALEAAIQVERQLLDDEDATIALLLS